MEQPELFGPISESVQTFGLKLPEPSLVHVTTPIGALGAVVLVSVTVAVHVDNWPPTTGEPHSLLPELSIVETSTTLGPLAVLTVHEPVVVAPLIQIDVSDGLKIRLPRVALVGIR